MDNLIDTTQMASIAILGFTTFIVWFFKTIYSQHQQIFDYYTKNKEADIHKLAMDMEILKREINKVELDSKRYWSEQKERATSNHEKLLERINHTNDNTKASGIMIKEYLERLENRLDKFEDRLNNQS